MSARGWARRVAPVLLAASLASTSVAVSVVGTSPPWRGDASYRRLSAPEAVREVAAGRADVALVSLPSAERLENVGELLWVPVGVYAVRVAYRLPGVELRLDSRAACGLFSGRIRMWNDPELARLNPGAALPSLPVLSVARGWPNAASFAFADACVRGGVWPRAWRKSSWQGHAISVAADAKAVEGALGMTGSVTVLGPREVTPSGVGEARVLAVGGEFVAPTASLGLARPERLPKGPAQFLPFASVPGAYAFRGLVWAVVPRDQRYRNRTLRDAQDVAAFLEDLRSEGGRDLQPLPPAFRAPISLSYGGEPLAPSEVNPR